MKDSKHLIYCRVFIVLQKYPLSQISKKKKVARVFIKLQLLEVAKASVAAQNKRVAEASVATQNKKRSKI
ncbi:hypothetical protein FACS1894132_10660 [Clostridia bacterium]|nr:hypothetical protein FACS1894132_10660 [Clostridia bacterium]